MDFSQEKEKCKSVIFGYIVMTLKNFEYSENKIKLFLTDIEKHMKNFSDEQALEYLDNFFDDSKKKIIFDGIEIPRKYNMCKIRDLFEKHQLIKKERPYIGEKICHSLENNRIIYIKDLYEKTKNDILKIHGIGVETYKYFIVALNKFFGLC